MDKMSKAERPVPETAIRGPEKTHEEALRINTIFDGLVSRREHFFRETPQGRGMVEKIFGGKVPELNRKKYRQRAGLYLRIHEGEFTSKSKRTQRRALSVAEQALRRQLLSAEERLMEKPKPPEAKVVGEAPPIAPEEEREEVPPAEKVEKISLLERLSQAKQELRKRFKGRAELKVGERAGALLEGLQRKVPHIDWKTLPPKAKERTLNLLRKTGSPRLAGTMEALGALISREKWNAVLERRKRDIEVGRKKIEEGLEKAKGIRVLAWPGAVKKWVARRWEGAVVPKKEDLKKTLEAKKAKMRMPEFRKLSPKELSKRWKEMDPETRRKIKIRVGIGAAVGVVGGLVAWEIIGRHGREFQIVAQHLSGLTQAAREMLARAPEIPKPPPEIREVVKKGVTFPQETSVQVDEVARRLGEEMQKWRLAEQAAEKFPGLTDLKAEIAAKGAAVKAAAEQVRQLAQTGIEIVKGSHAWGASGEAAKQVFESSGVQSDPERLTILTDAIKDASELGDLVQPGTMLKLKPGTVADILRKTIESIPKVKAVGGTLEVPADEADLRALARVTEYLSRIS